MGKKRSSNPRGLAPADDVVRQQGRRGYYLVAALAKRHDVAASTIYDWIRLDKLEAPGDDRPIAFKDGGNLWVLGWSVAARLAARNI